MKQLFLQIDTLFNILFMYFKKSMPLYLYDDISSYKLYLFSYYSSIVQPYGAVCCLSENLFCNTFSGVLIKMTFSIFFKQFADS